MKKKLAVGKIAGFVFYALIFMMMAVIILSLLFKNKEKNEFSLGSYSMFTVLTGSMSPTFEAGSVIITQKVDADKLQTGDILTYAPLDNNNTLVTHRIVEVVNDDTGYSYITRGDANNVNDLAPVPYEAVVGRVIFWMNGVGTVLLFIRTPRGIAFTVMIVLLLMLLSFLLGKLKECVLEEKRNDAASQNKTGDGKP